MNLQRFWSILVIKIKCKLKEFFNWIFLTKIVKRKIKILTLATHIQSVFCSKIKITSNFLNKLMNFQLKTCTTFPEIRHFEFQLTTDWRVLICCFFSAIGLVSKKLGLCKYLLTLIFLAIFFIKFDLTNINGHEFLSK